jgi:hypothetical protein
MIWRTNLVSKALAKVLRYQVRVKPGICTEFIKRDPLTHWLIEGLTDIAEQFHGHAGSDTKQLHRIAGVYNETFRSSHIMIFDWLHPVAGLLVSTVGFSRSGLGQLWELQREILLLYSDFGDRSFPVHQLFKQQGGEKAGGSTEDTEHQGFSCIAPGKGTDHTEE